MSENRLMIHFEKWLQFLVAILVIAAAAAAAVILVRSREAPARVEAKRPAPLVEVAQISVGDRQMIVTGFATAEAKIEVEISPQVPGKVVWVNPQFHPGGFIDANLPIIKIDPRDYELAVQRAEAAIAEARVTLDTEQAEAQVAAKEWEQLNPGRQPDSPLVLREPQIRRAEAVLASAEAALKTAELNLERTVITLPIDVQVVSQRVDLGQFIAVGVSIGAAYGTDVMEVEVPLENSELAWFDIPRGPNGSQESGSPAEVTADVAGRRVTWSGRVKRTTGQVDRTTRLISVVVEVSSEAHNAALPRLIPGTFVDVRILGNTLKDAAAIPRDAVRQGNRVWLVNSGKLQIVELDIVRTDRDFAYAASGLQDGALIITSALDVVTNGMAVRTTAEGAQSANALPGAGEDVNEEAGK